MILKSFKIWNFKSIEYSNEINLKKLIVNIGPNNSGKSNLNQAIILMKQTFENHDPILPLTLNGPLINLGEFKDLIFQHDLERDFKIEFIFESELCYVCMICGDLFSRRGLIKSHILNYHSNLEDFDDYIKYKESNGEKELFSLRFSYFYDQKNEIIKIKEILFQSKGYKEKAESLVFIFKQESIFTKISTSKGNFNAEGYIKESQEHQAPDHRKIFSQFEALNYVFQKEVKISKIRKNRGKEVLDLYNPKNSSESFQFKIEINDFEKFVEDYDRENYPSLYSFYVNIRETMLETYHYLRDILISSRYIGPLRDTPSRIFFSSGGNPKSVGLAGEQTYEILWKDSQSNKELERDLNYWLMKMGFNSNLRVQKLGSSNVYQIFMEENGTMFNIRDVGFGISQILPILVECLILSKYSSQYQLINYEKGRRNFYLVNRRLLIIEEPEIHLNPKIQTILGDFFIYTSNEYTPFIIETHSVNILNRIQRRIIEKKFDFSDVVINFFEKKNNRTIITQIYLNEIGNYSFWPKNFFQDDYTETIKMIKGTFKENSEE